MFRLVLTAASLKSINQLFLTNKHETLRLAEYKNRVNSIRVVKRYLSGITLIVYICLQAGCGNFGLRFLVVA